MLRRLLLSLVAVTVSARWCRAADITERQNLLPQSRESVGNHRCRGRSSDMPHCIVHLNTPVSVGQNDPYYGGGPQAATQASSRSINPPPPSVAAAAAAPNMTCPCDKAPCPNPKCPCIPGSFGCPGFDPAFDLTKVSFAANFGDGMVLQRAVNVAAPDAQRSSVYGTATPGARVQFAVDGNTGAQWKRETVVVDEPSRPEIHGTWKILLPPFEANLRGYTLTAKCAGCPNATTATITNVSFGDLWICSGQSNMEDPVSQTFARNASLDAADAGEYDRVALFQTWWRPRKNATYILPPGGPGTSMPRQTKWHTPCGMHNCSALDGGSVVKGSINGFSAACWYHLRNINMLIRTLA
jgi:hypothetical protein